MVNSSVGTELNSKCQKKSYSVTPQGEAIFYDKYTWLEKKNDIFFFQFMLTNTSDVTGNVIAKIPKECATNKQVWFPIYESNGGNYIGRGTINGENVAVIRIEKFSGETVGFCTYAV